MQLIDNETGNIDFVDHPMVTFISPAPSMRMVSPSPSMGRLLRGNVSGLQQCIQLHQLRLSLWICDQFDHSDSFIHLLFYVVSLHLVTAFTTYGYFYRFWKYLSLQCVYAILWWRDFVILLFGRDCHTLCLWCLVLGERWNHKIAKSRAQWITESSH